MTDTLQFHGPGFQLAVPTNWQSSATPQIQALFIAPQAEGAIPPTFAVALRPVQPDVTLSVLTGQLRQQMPDEYPGFALREESQLEISGQPAVAFDYDWFNPEQDTAIRQRQVLILHNSMVYILTSTCPAGAPAEVMDQMQQAEQSLVLQA